jgi:hypothetical protein
MTVTEPDLDLIKKEIITILKTKDTLWQEDNHVKGFTAIEVGLPVENEWKGLTYPICFVANDQSLETDKILGNPISGELRDSDHIFKFRIIFFDQGATGQEVEKSLDGFYKIVKETLKENYKLNSVQGIISSFPNTGHSFNFGEFEGQAIDGRVIILTVRVAST